MDFLVAFPTGINGVCGFWWGNGGDVELWMGALIHLKVVSTPTYHIPVVLSVRLSVALPLFAPTNTSPCRAEPINSLLRGLLVGNVLTAAQYFEV